MISFLLFTWLSAQTVVPFSSTPPSIPPTGEAQIVGLKCYNDPNCKANINLHVSCYGTNLRYVNAPLQNTSLIRGNIRLNDYNFDIAFPALYTYRVSASTICSIGTVTNGNVTAKCAGTDFNLKNYVGTGTGTASQMSSGLTCVSPAKCSCVYDIQRTSGALYSRTGNVICNTPLTKKHPSVFTIPQSGGAMATVMTTVGQKIEIKLTGDKSVPPKMPEMVQKGDTLELQEGSTSLVPQVTFFQSPGRDIGGTWWGSTPTVNDEHLMNSITSGLTANIEKNEASHLSGYREITINARFPGMNNFCGGYYSPLMLFFDAKRPKFTGVSEFPLNKDIKFVNWPEANSSGYWLVYDKKGKGEITKADQLFGSNESGEYTNGFEALREYDSNKDALISKGDKQWKNLYLWNDKNGDGVSDKGEVFKLEDFGLESISLAYTSNQTAQVGDRAAFRERAHFTFVKDGKAAFGEVVDVWVTPHMLSRVPTVADSSK